MTFSFLSVTARVNTSNSLKFMGGGAGGQRGSQGERRGERKKADFGKGIGIQFSTCEV